MSSEPQLQASLGEITSVKTKKDRNWNMGYLALGKVLRVHPKRYTADVQIFGTNDVVMSAKDQEGRHACRIGVNNAGWDETYKKPYGEIIPIQKGSIVLVGFLKNYKEKPVILKVFHNISEDLGQSNQKNILNALYSSDADDEIGRYVNISNIQDFISIDKEGNFEIASHTKSFLVGKERAMDDEFYDYEDLETKNADQTTLSVDEKYSIPKKYMAVFRDNYTDELTNWLKFIVDSKQTSFKLAKLQQKENKSTYMEIDQQGTIKVRRQLDTKSFEDSEKYAEVSIASNGLITLQTKGSSNNLIMINPEGGVTISTSNSVIVNSSKDVGISSNTMNISSSKINITGAVTMQGSVAMQGSVNMKGAIDILGNVSTIGGNRVNGRKVTVVGDIDSGKDMGLSSIGQIVATQCEAMCQRNLLSIVKDLSPLSGIMSAIQLATGFNLNFDLSLGNVTGNILNWSKENLLALNAFCDLKGLLPSDMTSQLSFLSEGLGVDLSKLTRSLGQAIGAVESANNFLKWVELPNDIASTLQTITNKIPIPSAITSAIPGINSILQGNLPKIDINFNWGALGTNINLPNLEDIIHEGDPKVTHGILGEITGSKYTIDEALEDMANHIPRLLDEVDKLKDSIKTDIDKVGSSLSGASVIADEDVDHIIKIYAYQSCEDLINRGHNSLGYFNLYA